MVSYKWLLIFFMYLIRPISEFVFQNIDCVDLGPFGRILLLIGQHHNDSIDNTSSSSDLSELN